VIPHHDTANPAIEAILPVPAIVFHVASRATDKERWMSFFKEFPFTAGFAIAGAGVAAWLSWRWWAILIALVVGFLIGATIDEISKRRAGTT
jgi:hypothetical protein